MDKSIAKEYAFRSDFIEAEKMLSELKRIFSEHISEAEEKKISLAVYELIINAIEHGNLEITRKEKKEHLKENTYNKLIRKRQSIPKLGKRLVKLSLKIENNSISVEIEDEGKGFDWKKDMERSIKKHSGDKVSFAQSGRGLFIIDAYLDEVRYNKKGNIVCAKKYIGTK